jgi:hypothetical protein
VLLSRLCKSAQPGMAVPLNIEGGDDWVNAGRFLRAPRQKEGTMYRAPTKCEEKRRAECWPVEKLRMDGHHNWCGAGGQSIQALVENAETEEREEPELPKRTGESRA